MWKAATCKQKESKLPLSNRDARAGKNKAGYHLKLNPSVTRSQHFHGRYPMHAIRIPTKQWEMEKGAAARNNYVPVPNEAHCFLALLAHEPAILHLFKQLLFSFGARKKHANAEGNVKSTTLKQSNATDTRCMQDGRTAAPHLLMSSAVSISPITLLNTCKQT